MTTYIVGLEDKIADELSRRGLLKIKSINEGGIDGVLPNVDAIYHVSADDKNPIPRISILYEDATSIELNYNVYRRLEVY